MIIATPLEQNHWNECTIKQVFIVWINCIKIKKMHIFFSSSTLMRGIFHHNQWHHLWSLSNYQGGPVQSYTFDIWWTLDKVVVKRIGRHHVIVTRLQNISPRMNYFSNVKHSMPMLWLLCQIICRMLCTYNGKSSSIFNSLFHNYYNCKVVRDLTATRIPKFVGGEE